MNVIKVLCNLGKGKGSQEIRYLEAESEVNFLKCFFLPTCSFSVISASAV